MNCSGVDNFPKFIKIDESNNFLIYSNQFQCTTNTSIIVYGTADGIVETEMEFSKRTYYECNKR